MSARGRGRAVSERLMPLKSAGEEPSTAASRSVTAEIDRAANEQGDFGGCRGSCPGQKPHGQEKVATIPFDGLFSSIHRRCSRAISLLDDRSAQSSQRRRSASTRCPPIDFFFFHYLFIYFYFRSIKGVFLRCSDVTMGRSRSLE